MTPPISLSTEVIRLFTQDGVELHGLAFFPRSQKLSLGVIHVHGLAGNFYENRFIYEMAQQAVDKGYTFLTFNNRGHDYISDINKETSDGCESVRAGGAYEKFADCAYDISAAISFLQSRGLHSFVLQGHSTGANKVVFFQSRLQHAEVKGLALLSPCDDVALQRNATGQRADKLLEMARSLISEGRGSDLMPDGSYYSYPMSAATFYDYFGPDADRNVFPYRMPDGEFRAVAAIRVPILSTFGGKADALLIPQHEACSLLTSKAVQSPKVTCSIIDGASHSYLGYERALAKQVTEWIADKLFQ